MAKFSFASTMLKTLLLVSCVVDHLRVSAGEEWSYEKKGETGPASWSKIAPTCGGKSQSPIDITKGSSTYNRDIPAIKFDGYNSTPAGNYIFTNIGHTVQLKVPVEAMSISGGGLPGRYKLAQIHAHWGATDNVGSEHTVEGKPFPMELHFVHFSERFGSVKDAADDPQGLAVIGVFVEVGEKSRLAEAIVSQLSRVQFKGTFINDMPSFKIDNLLPLGASTEFVRYNGSLTTPNCQQSVIWTILRNSIALTKDQLKAFRGLSKGLANETVAALQDNNRPVQALESRTVLRTFQSGAGRDPVFSIGCVLLSLVLQLHGTLL